MSYLTFHQISQGIKQILKLDMYRKLRLATNNNNINHNSVIN